MNENASWRIIQNENNQNRTSNPKLGHVETQIQGQNLQSFNGTKMVVVT